MTHIIRIIMLWLFATLVLSPWSAPATAQGSAPAALFKPEELDQLVAPIALYPDSLLAQVLMASTYPLEIVSAARWVKANPKLKDQALEDALQTQPWDPSVKSLTVFPEVLTMMNEKLDWTQKLGDAFLAQQIDVLNAIQRLRSKAQAQGNLKTTQVAPAGCSAAGDPCHHADARRGMQPVHLSGRAQTEALRVC